MNKPIAESCLRNQHPIYEVLASYCHDKSLKIFEIGSGTGQHAVYVANALPHITWQPSEIEAYLPAIELWLGDALHKNVLSPILFDVDRPGDIKTASDLVFTANTIHFVSKATGENILRCASRQLVDEGLFLIYGPFNDNGAYTSEGNVRLDQWLKERNPESGIRDQQWVEQYAAQFDLHLEAVHPMPANNFILVFRKIVRA